MRFCNEADDILTGLIRNGLCIPRKFVGISLFNKMELDIVAANGDQKWSGADQEKQVDNFFSPILREFCVKTNGVN